MKNSPAIFLTIMLLTGQCPAFAASADPLWGVNEDKYKDIKVERVVSADTIRLENDEEIRLIGLKALPPPARKRVEHDEHGFIIEDDDPTIALDEQAFSFVKELLEGQRVRLEFDATQKSEDFATFAYVFLKDDTFVNAEILRQGFADLKIEPPNNKHDKELRAAYQEARQERRGLQGE